MAENLIQQHAILLKDTVRMEAYRKAIEEVVRPGSVVLDIGCGLGILSFLALKAGAKHVHAVDVEPNTLNLAKLVAKHNGFEKKIIFHKGLSVKTRLKEKVDVIVTELFGNLGLNENVLPVLIDARNRLLKKDGKIIPKSAKLFFAPCEHKDWEFTLRSLHKIYDIDMLPDIEAVDLGTPSVSIKNEELLAEPKMFVDVNFETIKQISIRNKITFEFSRNGPLTGFAGWFESNLTDKISLKTDPNSLTTHWKQGFLPLRASIPVKTGQKITFELEIAPDQTGLNSLIGYSYNI